MIIELFDYVGQGVPRQVLANLPFVIDNKKGECIIFFPDKRQMDFKFYVWEYTGDWVKFYLYQNKEEWEKGAK